MYNNLTPLNFFTQNNSHLRTLFYFLLSYLRECLQVPAEDGQCVDGHSVLAGPVHIEHAVLQHEPAALPLARARAPSQVARHLRPLVIGTNLPQVGKFVRKIWRNVGKVDILRKRQFLTSEQRRQIVNILTLPSDMLNAMTGSEYFLKKKHRCRRAGGCSVYSQHYFGEKERAL